MRTNPVVPVSSHSPLRYHGGKTRAIKLLAYELPTTPYQKVLSPFIGGGSFELYLTGLGKQVTGYDLYSPLVTFWQTLLTRPKELADLCEPLLGQVDKELFNTLKTSIIGETIKDDNELAKAYFIVNRCSFSGSTTSGGFSKQSASPKGRFTPSSIDRLRTFSNSRLTIEKANFITTLSNPDDYGFVFLDPPYALGDNSRLYGSNGMHTRALTTLPSLTSLVS